jgi:hypothetical protein
VILSAFYRREMSVDLDLPLETDDTQAASAADFISLEVDSLCYWYDGTRCCVTEPARGMKPFAFPRNFVWFEGVVVRVEAIEFIYHPRNLRNLNVKLCIPSSVQFLTPHSFQYTVTLSTVTFECDSKLFCIRENAFAYCSSLLSICLPRSVEAVGNDCFLECSSLSAVTFEFGSKLSAIGAQVFWHCSSLSSICFPSGLQRLERHALNGTNLSPISVEGGNCCFKVIEHFRVNFEGDSILRYCGNVSCLTIPRGIKQLGCSCFRDSLRVSSVIFESDSTLSFIDDWAFEESSLVSICIPSSTEKLGHACFWACRSLLTVTFEPGCKLSCIESDTFGNCTSLSSICIPSSVDELSYGCFSGCSGLLIVTFESGSHLSDISTSAFASCTSLSSICVPPSVQRLCGHCFSGCSSLSDVTFESDSQLLCIAERAFYQCVSLASICIPSSVEILERDCFCECDHLSTIRFESGSHLSTIGSGSFIASICAPPFVRAALDRYSALLNLIGRGEIVDDVGGDLAVSAWPDSDSE